MFIRKVQIAMIAITNAGLQEKIEEADFIVAFGSRLFQKPETSACRLLIRENNLQPRIID